MKKVHILLYSILYSTGIFAQQIAPDAAFERALTQNLSLLQEKTRLELARLTLRQAKQSWTGRVDASLDTRYNLARQTLVLPAEAFGGPAGQFRNIQQGTPWLMTPALDLTQPLYKPALHAEQLNAGAALLSAETQFNEKTQDTRFDVYSAYLELALAEEKVKQAQVNLEKCSTEKIRTGAAMSEGRARDTDYERALLNEQVAQSDLAKTRNAMARASAALSRAMGDSVLVNTYQSTGLENFYNTEIQRIPAALAPQSSFSVLRVTDQLREKQVQLRGNRLYYAPEINFYGRLATQAFRERFDFYKTSAQWYGYSYLGLEIKLPLFDGLSARRTEQRVRLEQQQLQYALKEEIQRVSYDYSDARWQFETAAADVKNRSSELELARRIVQQNQQLLAEGRATQNELSDAEKTYSDTRMNLMNAYADQLKALFMQRKVIGSWGSKE